jgi:hypothetical protein
MDFQKVAQQVKRNPEIIFRGVLNPISPWVPGGCKTLGATEEFKFINEFLTERKQLHSMNQGSTWG